MLHWMESIVLVEDICVQTGCTTCSPPSHANSGLCEKIPDDVQHGEMTAQTAWKVFPVQPILFTPN